MPSREQPQPVFHLEPSDEEVLALFDHIVERGLARASAQGPDAFSEGDFLTGAMTVLHAIGLWTHVPPMWTIGILTGRSVLGLNDPAWEAGRRLRSEARSLLDAAEIILRETRYYQANRAQHPTISDMSLDRLAELVAEITGRMPR